VKTFAGQGQKMVIYWQTKAAYVILQNELSYGNAMGAQCRKPRTFWRVHAARSGNTKKRKGENTMEEKNQPRRPRRSPEENPQKNESLVYGKNPVTELLKSGSGVDTVLIA